MTDDYRVQLDVYNGPLDLLLYLIRREELDIHDIPIAQIAEQYVGYVELIQQLDPDVAGEFLVLASMLMEIKSRTLLPRPPADEAEEFVDPRLELVRQLLEYKRFKDAAGHLHDAAQEQLLRFPRKPVEAEPEDPKNVDIDSVGMWDLVEAFRDVMAKTSRFRPHEVQYDDTPMALHAADVVDRIEREGGSIEFAEIFEARTRSECIGLFLALLELVKQNRLRVEQDAPFEPIFVHLLDATPIEEPAEPESTFVAYVGGEPAPDAPADQVSPAATPQTPEDAADPVTGPDEANPPGDQVADESPQRPERWTRRKPAIRLVEDDDDEFGPMPEVPELPNLSHTPPGPPDTDDGQAAPPPSETPEEGPTGQPFDTDKTPDPPEPEA